MFGWCKPRKTFTCRCIGATEFQFDEGKSYLFDQVEGGYSIDEMDIVYTEDSFHRKFIVVEREVSWYENDCMIEISAYKEISNENKQSFLIYEDYKEDYFNWLNGLYCFKGNIAFQELIDFEGNGRQIDSKVSKKLFCDFKKHHNEAIMYSRKFEKKEWFINLYENMMKAFEFASNDGKVEFCE